MKILGIIPARYASTRFPGKVLAVINGKPMIQRVYEQSLRAAKLDKVIIATDNEQVAEAAKAFHAPVIMTDEDHPSGTDRCQEAAERSGLDPDYVINIQGDEPTIDPEQIDALASVLDGKTEIATMVIRLSDPAEITDPDRVKVVTDHLGNALYFSRSPVPHLRGVPPEKWSEKHTYFKHLGMYAYRRDILASITRLEPSSLEKAEALEQLRWLENGFTIRTVETSRDSICIDTPADLEKLLTSGQV